MWGKRMGSATATGVMSIARLAEIVDAYGGRPERWPASERAAALALIKTKPEARDLVREGLRLDNALESVLAVAPSIDLRARILRDFEIARKRSAAASTASRFGAIVERIRDAVWPGVPVWKLASALAVSLVIGLVAGTIIPAEFASRDENDQLLVLDSGPSLAQEI